MYVGVAVGDMDGFKVGDRVGRIVEGGAVGGKEGMVVGIIVGTAIYLNRKYLRNYIQVNYNR